MVRLRLQTDRRFSLNEQNSSYAFQGTKIGCCTLKTLTYVQQWHKLVNTARRDKIKRLSTEEMLFFQTTVVPQ